MMTCTWRWSQLDHKDSIDSPSYTIISSSLSHMLLPTLTPSPALISHFPLSHPPPPSSLILSSPLLSPPSAPLFPSLLLSFTLRRLTRVRDSPRWWEMETEIVVADMLTHWLSSQYVYLCLSVCLLCCLIRWCCLYSCHIYTTPSLSIPVLPSSPILTFPVLSCSDLFPTPLPSLMLPLSPLPFCLPSPLLSLLSPLSPLFRWVSAQYQSQRDGVPCVRCAISRGSALPPVAL